MLQANNDPDKRAYDAVKGQAKITNRWPVGATEDPEAIPENIAGYR